MAEVKKMVGVCFDNTVYAVLFSSSDQPWTGVPLGHRVPTPWAYAPESEWHTKGEHELSVYRRSVDQMNIDVNRMNSRISQLETENEHLETNVCVSLKVGML